MLHLRKPSPAAIQEFLVAQANVNLTYAPVGATATVPPAGYVVDHTRIKLGEGKAIFQAAQSALKHWDHFRLGWVQTHPPDTPLKVGQVVAVLARIFGFWWQSACRIVYVVDEEGAVQRFGFAYGTLPEHPESGEERSTR